MSDTDIHSCGYYCDRPPCIKAQRDELRQKLFSDQAVKTYSGGKPNYTQPEPDCYGDGNVYRGLRSRDSEAKTIYTDTWMKECAKFWDRYTYLNEMAQERYREEAQMWLEKLRSAPTKKEWVGLTSEELEFYTEELGQGELGRGVLRAVDDFLREKNNGNN